MSKVTIGFEPTYNFQNGESMHLPMHAEYMNCRDKRKIFVVHRRGLKTTTSLTEIFKYLISNPKIVGKTIAPKRKQAKEIIWDDPDMLFKLVPEELIASVNRTSLMITLKNGSLWYLDGADNPHGQRGGNVKVLHMAETGDHKEETWSQVYEPVLMANGGVALFEGNPRGRNWYYKLFLRSQERKGWSSWLLSAKDSGIFNEEELKDLEMNNPYNVFASEYLCEWVDSTGTVFRTFRDVANAEEQEARWGRSYRMGVDLAKVEDYTVTSIVDRHTWEQVHLDRWNQVDWTIQKDRIKQKMLAYSKRETANSLEVLVESNGPGDPIFDDLFAWAAQQEDHEITMINYVTTSAKKALLVQNFSMLCDQKIIAILPTDYLMEECENFTYEKNSLGFRYGAPDGYHDDAVMATMFSFWELGGKMPVPQNPDDLPKTQWGFTQEQLEKLQQQQAPDDPYKLI